MPRFFLPTRRQYRCLSSCFSMFFVTMIGFIVLLFAAQAALPSLTNYLEQFDNSPILDLALDEIYEIDAVGLHISSIERQVDGAITVVVDWLVDGLPSTSVDLSFNSSFEHSGSVSLLPGGYTLRLISASSHEQSVRLQIFSPPKEN